MGAAQTAHGPRRDETPAEKLDRNLTELMAELRVALPGVQVLFAFLLTVPFSTRFAEVSSFERRVYFFTLLCSAAASALLIAPSAYHRLVFGRRDKEHIVRTANRMAVAGLAVLALAMTGAILLVTHFIFGPTAAAIATPCVALLFVGLWYAAPLARRRSLESAD